MTGRVIPYNPTHAYAILDRNVRERDMWLSKFPDWEEFATGWKNAGPAYTFMVGDDVVACGGVVLQKWQRGEAWSLFSSLFYKYKKTCFSVCKIYLNRIIKDQNLRRVQAVTAPTFAEGRNFLEHLDFRLEGTLVAFGPNGEDVLMYGRRC